VSDRAAGLLLHPTSLPGSFGVGDFGPEAERFLDWAASAGQSLWQILPLSPTGGFDSPYGGISAFAGNPLLISPERLVEEGLLGPEELTRAPRFSPGAVDFGYVRAWKESVLRSSWSRFERAPRGASDELEAFRQSPRQATWLADWSLYRALAEKLAPDPWNRWPPELARREPDALAAARQELSEPIAYYEYVQWLFFRQWDLVRRAAQRRGISIIGDVPIYVSHESVDVWSHSRQFELDANGDPEMVAGVPPDAFSETGQLWGYPVYRWDIMKEDGYSWWIERLDCASTAADLLRIDHFRGFESYWAVPGFATDARSGAWRPGPGGSFFRAVHAALKDLRLIAEDLGVITDEVIELRKAAGIPGMKVLQFAFSEDDSPHAPHRHVADAVVYTGTHDNDTARGWYAALSPEERSRLGEYLGGDGFEIEWDLIRAAYASVADRAIVPLQDVFGLASEARMNTPAKAHGNWAWRARREDFTPERAERLKRLAVLTGRSSQLSAHSSQPDR
jgi:4-alpha-glucanotransferase